jgi:hypothetical protein
MRPPAPEPDGCHWQIPGVPKAPVVGAAPKSISPSGGWVAWVSVSVAVQLVEVEIWTTDGLHVIVVVVTSTAVGESLPLLPR